jgi:hypothetical protein
VDGAEELREGEVEGYSRIEEPEAREAVSRPVRTLPELTRGEEPPLEG